MKVPWSDFIQNVSDSVQVLKQVDKSRQIGLFQKVITTFEKIFLYYISMKYEYLKKTEKVGTYL